MHFDPVGSEETSSADLQDFATEQPELREDDAPSPGAREGLPKRFRMRHGRHYVDELLGEAPLRTVREIPISEIEPPPPDMLGLSPDGIDALEASIRRLGVIEPLAVARRGAEYRVITGMRRLRAARTVGLSTVPCLVHDVDDVRLMDLREAAISPVVVPAAPPAANEPSSEGSAQPISRLRDSVLAELEQVESLRAKTVSTAADLLARSAIVPEPAAVSCTELIEDALRGIAGEARLRGVTVHLGHLPADGAFALDGPRCRLALLGLFQALIGLSDRSGGVLDVRAQITSVRPALIIDCQLRDGGVAITEDAASRFFDEGWLEHPAGADGAVLLAAVARIARAHGGRVQAHSGGIVTFVIPRPLTDQ